MAFLRLKSEGLYEMDEVVSATQKSVRRGKVEEALFWSVELMRSGYGQYLVRKLMGTVSCEDVGLGWPGAALAVDACFEKWSKGRGKGKGKLSVKDACRNASLNEPILSLIARLCSAPKSRFAALASFRALSLAQEAQEKKHEKEEKKGEKKEEKKGASLLQELMACCEACKIASGEELSGKVDDLLRTAHLFHVAFFSGGKAKERDLWQRRCAKESKVAVEHAKLAMKKDFGSSRLSFMMSVLLSSVPAWSLAAGSSELNPELSAEDRKLVLAASARCSAKQGQGRTLSIPLWALDKHTRRGRGQGASLVAALIRKHPAAERWAPEELAKSHFVVSSKGEGESEEKKGESQEKKGESEEGGVCSLVGFFLTEGALLSNPWNFSSDPLIVGIEARAREDYIQCESAYGSSKAKTRHMISRQRREWLDELLLLRYRHQIPQKKKKQKKEKEKTEKEKKEKEKKEEKTPQKKRKAEKGELIEKKEKVPKKEQKERAPARSEPPQKQNANKKGKKRKAEEDEEEDEKEEPKRKKKKARAPPPKPKALGGEEMKKLKALVEPLDKKRFESIKDMPLGQLPCGPAKKKVHFDLNGVDVWKGPYDLSKPSRAQQLWRTVCNTERLRSLGLRVPPISLAGCKEEKSGLWQGGPVFLRMPQLSPVPPSQWKVEKEGKACLDVVQRQSAGVNIARLLTAEDWGKGELLIDAIGCLLGRYVCEPTLGDSHTNNLLVVKKKQEQSGEQKDQKREQEAEERELWCVDLDELRGGEAERQLPSGSSWPEEKEWRGLLFTGKRPKAHIIKAWEKLMKQSAPHKKALASLIRSFLDAPGSLVSASKKASISVAFAFAL